MKVNRATPIQTKTEERHIDTGEVYEVFSMFDREKAKDKATALQASSNMVVFSDASGQNNHLGAAAVMLDHNQEVIESRQLSIGSMASWTVYAAEFIGIFYAISLVLKVASSGPGVPTTSQQEPATILCDNMSALQAIRNPLNKSGQRIIHASLQAASELRTRGIPLRLQWIPGHCDNPGNDAADKLAKIAVGSNKMHSFSRLVSQERAGIRKQILKEWEQEWKTSKKGSHLRRIDSKCQPSAPDDYTTRCHGTVPIYLPSYGLATAGWRLTGSSMDTGKTINVNAGPRKRSPTSYLTAQN